MYKLYKVLGDRKKLQTRSTDLRPRRDFYGPLMYQTEKDTTSSIYADSIKKCAERVGVASNPWYVHQTHIYKLVYVLTRVNIYVIDNV